MESVSFALGLFIVITVYWDVCVLLKSVDELFNILRMYIFIIYLLQNFNLPPLSF